MEDMTWVGSWVTHTHTSPSLPAKQKQRLGLELAVIMSTVKTTSPNVAIEGPPGLQ